MACCLAAPRLTAAQGNDNPNLCWEPRPAPACRRILVTEVGVASSLSGTPVPYFTSEVGVMKSTASRGAVGLTLYSAMLDDDGRFGVKVRYRRWLGGRAFADAGAGVLLANASSRARHPGLVGHAGVGFSDWLSVNAQLEVARYETGWHTTAFLGARTGTYAGFGGNLLAVIFFLIWLSYGNTFDNQT